LLSTVRHQIVEVFSRLGAESDGYLVHITEKIDSEMVAAFCYFLEDYDISAGNKGAEHSLFGKNAIL
jgi:hypothetical protein